MSNETTVSVADFATQEVIDGLELIAAFADGVAEKFEEGSEEREALAGMLRGVIRILCPRAMRGSFWDGVLDAVKGDTTSLIAMAAAIGNAKDELELDSTNMSDMVAIAGYLGQYNANGIKSQLEKRGGQVEYNKETMEFVVS